MKKYRLSILLFFMFPLVWMGCSPDQGPVAFTPDEPAAKVAADQVVSGRYIVVLQDNVADVEQAATDLARRHGAAPEHIYRHALRGFSVALSARAATELVADPQVKYVEPDYIATATGSAQGKPGGGGGTASQTTPWGITRVGGAGDGTGKTAWVIDTGIDLDHPDLNVDVSRSRNFATGTSPDDGNGHGTHVAGTIAAINNTQGVVGVAANAKVVAVRVLDNRGSGYYSWVIAGVDYVATTATWGDVANMSLGGPPSQALDDAVRNAASSGIRFSIAAGNDGQDANNYSPARVEAVNVYTVSAVDSGDIFAYFSNYGNPPVDYAAPGVSVLSTWKGGGTKTLSGTSMAAPHVAGLLLRGGIADCGTAKGDKDTTPDPIPCASAL